MLAALAHQIVRHRRLVIGTGVVLTVFGAFSASQVSKRWFESFSIPGYSAYEANQRTLHTFGTGEQAPLVAVFHSSRDITKATGIEKAINAAASVNRGSRVSSYWSTGSTAYLSHDRRTAFAEIYPPGTPRRVFDRPRPAPGGGFRGQGPERSHRGADRGPRLARDPLLRVRNAAGRGDATRDRGRVDPEHVHARLAADLRHERVDHRAVPDRARRPGCGDRLRAADDLPFPRRVARRGGRRDRARRDDDARGPFRDRLRLDGRRRPAVVDHPAAAVHPLDRDRRDADPRGVGDRRGDAAPGPAVGTRHAHQQRSRAAQALRRPRPSRGRHLGALGRARHATARPGRGGRSRRGGIAPLFRPPVEPERGTGEGPARDR